MALISSDVKLINAEHKAETLQSLKLLEYNHSQCRKRYQMFQDDVFLIRKLQININKAIHK